MAHITGGGITDNLPRILPTARTRSIDRGAWHVPAAVPVAPARGQRADDDMLRTFNMGIGLIVVCAPDDAAR